MSYQKSRDWPGKAKPRIVCAAIMFSETTVVVGPRHNDPTMRSQLDVIDANKILRGETTVEEFRPIQGFIDQFGDFHTRTEAWKIAEANGQIIARCGGGTTICSTLYSENLY